MNFFKQLFAPEIESLERRLSESAERENRLLAQISELKSEFKTERELHREEISACRQREDELLNRVFEALKLSKITRPSEAPEDEEKLTGEDLEILRDRATEYCVQKYGESYTKDKYDEIFELMKADPEEWLSN